MTRRRFSLSCPVQACILLLLIFSAVPSAAQPKDSFLRDLNDFLDMREAKAYARMDTTYLDRYPYHWDARLFLNTEGLHFLTEGDGERNTRLSTGMSNRVGVSLGYRGLALSYSRTFGKKINFGLGISSYGTKLGFEYTLRATSELSGQVAFPGQEVRSADAGSLTMLASNFNLFYNFNPKFSYAAAMKQSKIQRRSAGSFIVAASCTLWDLLDAGPEIISAQTSAQTFLEATNLLYGRFSLGAGYGYNLVLGREHWLMHVSTVPMWTFYDFTNVRIDGKTQTYRHPMGKIRLTGTARAGIYYRWGTRWSIGLSGVVNQMASRNSIHSDANDYLRFGAQDWQARLSFSFRF